MEKFEYFQLISNLKHLPRKGWVERGVNQPETVASHMYRMAMCAFALKGTYDLEKVIKMCLVHDVGESIVGDITPADNVAPEEKYRQEEQAVQHIASLLPVWGKEQVLALWKAYEEEDSVEAAVVRDLDKFDMVVQAFEYEQKQGKNLSGFFQGVDVFKTEEVREWAQELYQRRNTYFNNSSLS